MFTLPQSESWEARIVSVSGHPLRTPFDCQRSQVSIRNDVSSGTSINAKLFKNVPVPLPSSYDYAVWAVSHIGDKLQGKVERGRISKNARMGDYAEKAAETDIGNSKGSIAADHVGEPLSKALVVGCIRPVGVYENINVY